MARGIQGATMRLMLMQATGQLLFSLASQLALLALAGTTAWLTMRGNLTVGAAVGLVVVLVRYLDPLATIAALAPALDSTRLALEKIRGFSTSRCGTATHRRCSPVSTSCSNPVPPRRWSAPPDPGRRC